MFFLQMEELSQCSRYPETVRYICNFFSVLNFIKWLVFYFYQNKRWKFYFYFWLPSSTSHLTSVFPDGQIHLKNGSDLTGTQVEPPRHVSLNEQGLVSIDNMRSKLDIWIIFIIIHKATLCYFITYFNAYSFLLPLLNLQRSYLFHIFSRCIHSDKNKRILSLHLMLNIAPCAGKEMIRMDLI